MFRHYLKISFRNLWKYKSQTLISVIGLAVGFACFAIATLWIRYEMTFDGFHKNSDRLYRVSVKDISGGNPSGTTNYINSTLATHLKKTFPEINNATKILDFQQLANRPTEVEINNNKITFNLLTVDSSFLKMFDIKLIDGNTDFTLPGSQKIAITQDKARKLFGNESPVGKTIKVFDEEVIIGAVITGFAGHSNYSFDMLRIFDDVYGHVVIELVPDVDVESFRKKLLEYKTTLGYNIMYYRENGVREKQIVNEKIENISIAPLTSIHYKDPYAKRSVKFQYIIIFAVAGSLLILCTLFNYLALFISRFRIRMRELALRVVCGASNRSLFTLLSVEFLMSLFISLVLGVFIIQAIIPYFRILSEADIKLSFIYFESLIYIVAIILVSLLVFLLTLAIFRRKTLNVAAGRGNRKMFRKVSIVVQLIISIVFAFCTTIILKQMHYLHNTADLGFSFKNRGSILSWWDGFDATVFDNLLKQIPEITGSVACSSIEDATITSSNTTYDWIGRPENVKPITMGCMYITEELAKFYNFKLVAGEMLSENDSDDENYVLINESALKVFGWNNPVGQTLDANAGFIHGNAIKIKYTVKGVIKNIYNNSPAIPVNPFIYHYKDRSDKAHSVLFQYREGTWKTCRDKINQLIKEKYPDAAGDSFLLTVRNMEEEYDKLLKSENTLLKILTMISAVCLIVCVFGFVSMVSLTCEERRKEIAIRKINGATIKDILDIFFKEHLILLGIGALIAFPTGYLIMKRWLEQYVLQTEMSAWVFVVILLALIMVIVLCVGGKVYRTSRENPVYAIKS
jgi:ABC-type lipoprotein release transport system permease subunit/heme/copper-type cytochrome/quinol oxidase subunit 2